LTVEVMPAFSGVGVGVTSLGQAAGLPSELTSFVGRRQEIAEVCAALSAARLVTLTGPGGVGKTRLALRVAHRLGRSFPDGVCLVELEELREPSLLATKVAEALGLRDQSRRDPELVLAQYLATRRVLLILDNCEHMVSECCRFVSALLPATSRLRILATGRRPLKVRAEQVWPVPPLSVPDPANSGEPVVAERYGGLALFEQRAAGVLPGFTVGPHNWQQVAAICQRLDGLPLAIELAAFWVRVLSVEEIRRRLDDHWVQGMPLGRRNAPARHQTLRAAADWSYELCSQRQRTLWRRLSVFVGSFDLRAAEAVCADEDWAPSDVLLSVSGLVEQSVLSRDDVGSRTRYRMPETLGQYGNERLRDSGEETRIRLRHRDYYLSLSVGLEATWFGPYQVEWLARLRAEHSNVESALEYCLSAPEEAHAGLRMAEGLWFYWIVCGFLRDGRYWLERALELNAEAGSGRVAALIAVGYIATRQGDLDSAVELLEEARGLAQQIGDEAGMALAMQTLGLAKAFGGAAADAVSLVEDALARHRANNAPDSDLALGLFRLASAVSLTLDFDRAIAAFEQCRQLCEANAERWCRCWALAGEAISSWMQDEVYQAELHAKNSLRHARALGDPTATAMNTELLAWIAAARHDPQRAAQLMGIGHRRWESLGKYLFGVSIYMDWHAQCQARCRELVGDQTVDDAFQAGARLTLDTAVAYALGEQAMPRSAATTSTDSPLTRREREIAELVGQGLSNRDIAAELVISKRTADSHVEHILTKLGFSSRTQIATWVTAQAASSPSS
jgi:non-specific serine/threonine protein kinase